MQVALRAIRERGLTWEALKANLGPLLKIHPSDYQWYLNQSEQELLFADNILGLLTRDRSAIVVELKDDSCYHRLHENFYFEDYP